MASRRTFDRGPVRGFRALLAASVMGLLATPAEARLDTLEVVARAPFDGGKTFGAAGAFEKLTLRARFSVDPSARANSIVADIAHATRAPDGRVRFDADLVVLQPVDAARGSGGAIVEPMNRGITQLLSMVQSTNAPVGSADDAALAGDGFILSRGHTLVFAGWQTLPGAGPTGDGRLAARLPVAAVGGIDRQELQVAGMKTEATIRLEPGTCALEPSGRDAKLGLRMSSTEVRWLPRSAWRFAADGKPDRCAVTFDAGFEPDRLHVLVYRPEPPAVAGLGLAALRDLASALKSGANLGPVRRVSRLVGYGYSQSARLLRQFVEDGFNADEGGQRAFDGLYVAAAGAGGASVNHRFAQPGVAGNSVTDFHFPVDLFPFADAGQRDPATGRGPAGKLDRARAAGVAPKIFHVFSSTEYWSRAGSLLHTSVDGRRDLPLAPEARLYLVAGTPHSGAPFPPVREARGNSFANPINDGRYRIWPMRALLVALDDWVARGVEPPASAHPRIADGTLIPFDRWRFPGTGQPVPTYRPGVWRVDFGRRFARERIIDRELPRLGAEYAILVPAVDADGNETAGIRPPTVAVPVAAWTGWNLDMPSRADIRVLGGLSGSVFPFDRATIAARHPSREAYLARVRAVAADLVSRRYLLPADLGGVEARALAEWDAFASMPARP